MQYLRYVQLIPTDLATAWDFFTSPRNLVVITPPGMGFTIQSGLPEKVYPGLIIKYRVKPMMGIPVTWVTEITHVQEPHFFVDEQRKGPYRMWHHEHHFKAVPGGVEMTDIIHYIVPMGVLGKGANSLFVRKKVEAIFAYRRQKLLELFGPMPG